MKEWTAAQRPASRLLFISATLPEATAPDGSSLYINQVLSFWNLSHGNYFCFQLLLCEWCLVCIQHDQIKTPLHREDKVMWKEWTASTWEKESNNASPFTAWNYVTIMCFNRRGNWLCKKNHYYGWLFFVMTICVSPHPISVHALKWCQEMSPEDDCWLPMRVTEIATRWLPPAINTLNKALSALYQNSWQNPLTSSLWDIRQLIENSSLLTAMRIRV